MDKNANCTNNLEQIRTNVRHVYEDFANSQIICDYYEELYVVLDEDGTIVYSNTEYLATFSEYGKNEAEMCIRFGYWDEIDFEILFNNPEVDYTIWHTILK